jgi:hypothetical protein
MSSYGAGVRPAPVGEVRSQNITGASSGFGALAARALAKGVRWHDGCQALEHLVRETRVGASLILRRSRLVARRARMREVRPTPPSALVLTVFQRSLTNVRRERDPEVDLGEISTRKTASGTTHHSRQERSR